MDYEVFQKKIEEVIATYNTEELKRSIIKISTIISAFKRDVFLSILKNSSDKNAIVESKNNQLEKDVDEIIEKLTKLEEQACFKCKYNKDYENWMEDESEYIFKDTDRILDAVKTAASLIHKCYVKNATVKGYELAICFANLIFDVNGEYYNDCIDVSGIIYEEGLIDDYPVFLLEECVCLAYEANQNNQLKVRIEKMVDILYIFGAWHVDLDKVFIMLSDDVDKEQFLTLLINKVSSDEYEFISGAEKLSDQAKKILNAISTKK